MLAFPSISKIGLLMTAILFYMGTNVIGFGTALAKGEIQNKGDFFKFLNPGENVVFYNKWFMESWEDFQNKENTTKINAIFGMFISGFALFVLSALIYTIISTPVNTEVYPLSRIWLFIITLLLFIIIEIIALGGIG